MTTTSSALPFTSRLRVGALAWVTDPSGVGIFNNPRGKVDYRLSRGYVVEITGGPAVKQYLKNGKSYKIIRWEVHSPRTEGNVRQWVKGWVGEGEVAAGEPAAQPVYWLQEIAATWVCTDAYHGTNLSNAREVFVTQHGNGLQLRDGPALNGTTVKQEFAAGKILPVRLRYECADHMVWWSVGLSGAATPQWCSEMDDAGYLLAPLEV